MMTMANWCGDWLGWMGVFPILGLGVMIVFLVLMFRCFSRGTTTGTSYPPCFPGETRSSVQDSVLEILKRRYAAGEIGKDEFESMKKDLL